MVGIGNMVEMLIGEASENLQLLLRSEVNTYRISKLHAD